MLIISLLLCALFLAACSIACAPRSSVKGTCKLPGYPIVGNALHLYRNPSLVLGQWAKSYRLPFLLVHLGPTPVVVVHGFHHALRLYSTNLVALNSRPTLYTFHHVVSAIQGFTVGTTPAGASFRRKKKCISAHLAASAVDSALITTALDTHSRLALRSVLSHCLSGAANCRTVLSDICMLEPAQHFVLGLAVDITYGYTLDCKQRDAALAAEIVATENEIIRTRALFLNFQDYLPVFRYWPLSMFRSSSAEYWRDKRDRYMLELYGGFARRLAKNDPAAARCMLGQIVGDATRYRHLSAEEIQSVCLTMVSAGLDNILLTYNHIMGLFSYPKQGYRIQERIYARLLDAYGDPASAWENVPLKTECTYALAVIHEALRHFSVLPLGLPRLTTRRINFNGMTVPENTIVVMNTYAANHDPLVFPDPAKFDPDRWLNSNGELKSRSEIQHLTFGVGSRKCSGDILAVKELYVLLCRTVLLFRIRRPTNTNYHMELDPFVGNLCPTGTSFEPKEFRVWLCPRQGPKMLDIHDMLLK